MSKSATAKEKISALMSDTIRGTVERLHCAYPSFSAGKLDSQDRVGSLVSFSAPIMLVEGARIIMKGHWTKDPKYGTQFKASTCEYDQKIDTKGLADWLDKNTLIKGIGRAKARRIADTFGESFDEVITNEPERVQALVGITDEQLSVLRGTWNEYRDYHKLITWLAGMGLSIFQIDQIKDTFGESAFGILQSNPYLIIGEIPGVQFGKTDKIALQSGIKKDHDSRIKEGIKWCVNEALREGSTYIDRNELVLKANKLLGLDTLDSKTVIAKKLDELIASHELIQRPLPLNKKAILNPGIAQKEQFLANFFLTNRNDFAPLCYPVDWDKVVSGGSDSSDTIDPFLATLNEAQRQAHDAAMGNCISLITGSAGSGKTHVIKGIVKHYEDRGFTVALCAPTGKAARRLAEVAKHEAKTIHRLLEFHPREGFQRNEHVPITEDVVIVDEVSMVDSELGYHFAKALDLTKTVLILVGDPNQLPPVGPGNILRDLLQTEAVPVTRLNTIMRQAGVLKANCSAILDGKLEKTCKPDEKGFVPWTVISSLTDPNRCKQEIVSGYEKILIGWPGCDIIHGIQILSPQRKGILGCNALNVELQRITQKIKWGVDVEETIEGKKPKFYVHDKVIQVHNDYELDVMNGQIGWVVSIENNGNLVVQFEGDDLATLIPPRKRINVELAYILSVHKTQGSQYPYVLLIIHKQHNFMHHRGIAYTGATRAQKKVIIFGDAWGMRNCMSKVEVDRRKTWFSELLRNNA